MLPVDFLYPIGQHQHLAWRYIDPATRWRNDATIESARIDWLECKGYAPEGRSTTTTTTIIIILLPWHAAGEKGR